MLGVVSYSEVVEAGVDLLWLLLVAAVLWRARRPILEDLLPRLTGVTIGGVGLTFAAAEKSLIEATKDRQLDLAPSARRRILRRAKRLAPVLRRVQVLWVDDHPEGNVEERHMLRELGAFVDLATSNNEGLQRFLETTYDIVISDIGRDQEEEEEEGLELPERLREADPRPPPLIFYVGDLKPEIPVGAVGITDRPDMLLELLFDALEGAQDKAATA